MAHPQAANPFDSPSLGQGNPFDSASPVTTTAGSENPFAAFPQQQAQPQQQNHPFALVQQQQIPQQQVQAQQQGLNPNLQAAQQNQQQYLQQQLVPVQQQQQQQQQQQLVPSQHVSNPYALTPATQTPPVQQQQIQPMVTAPQPAANPWNAGTTAALTAPTPVAPPPAGVGYPFDQFLLSPASPPPPNQEQQNQNGLNQSVPKSPDPFAGPQALVPRQQSQQQISTSAASALPARRASYSDIPSNLSSNELIPYATSPAEDEDASPTSPHTNKYSAILSQIAPADAAPLPKGELVVQSGYVLSRISFRTILLKKWKQSYWVQYGPHTMLWFRSHADFDDWLNNPYHNSAQRNFLIKLAVNFCHDLYKPNVRGYQVTQARTKPYGRKLLRQFKLERWMDYGPTIAAAFASHDPREVDGLRDAIVQCMRNTPTGSGIRATGAVRQPATEYQQQHQQEQYGADTHDSERSGYLPPSGYDAFGASNIVSDRPSPSHAVQYDPTRPPQQQVNVASAASTGSVGDLLGDQRELDDYSVGGNSAGAAVFYAGQNNNKPPQAPQRYYPEALQSQQQQQPVAAAAATGYPPQQYIQQSPVPYGGQQQHHVQNPY